jgi:hypothetical protein
MEFLEMVKTVVDKIKEPVQKANEKWDQLSRTWRTCIIAVALLVVLLVTGRAFTFVVVIVAALLRIFYYEGVFNGDEPELPTPIDEDFSD